MAQEKYLEDLYKRESMEDDHYVSKVLRSKKINREHKEEYWETVHIPFESDSWRSETVGAEIWVIAILDIEDVEAKAIQIIAYEKTEDAASPQILDSRDIEA